MKRRITLKSISFLNFTPVPQSYYNRRQQLQAHDPHTWSQEHCLAWEYVWMKYPAYKFIIYPLLSVVLTIKCDRHVWVTIKAITTDATCTSRWKSILLTSLGCFSIVLGEKDVPQEFQKPLLVWTIRKKSKQFFLCSKQNPSVSALLSHFWRLQDRDNRPLLQINSAPPDLAQCGGSGERNMVLVLEEIRRMYVHYHNYMSLILHYTCTELQYKFDSIFYEL